jgi:hypothetical protein
MTVAGNSVRSSEKSIRFLPFLDSAVDDTVENVINCSTF